MMPLPHSSTRRLVAAAVAFATVCLVSTELHAQGQQGGPSGRTRVLVPPLETGQGVGGGFGKNVAKRVRQRIEEFDILTPVTKDEIDQAVNKFDLNKNKMTRVQWRQLAGQIDAGLILFGRISQQDGSGGYRVEVQFVDAQTGDEMQAPQFSVPGNGGQAKQAAADRISGALDTQVTYQRSLLFCEDYYGANQYDDALRNCDQALEINAQSTRAHMIRGQIYRERAGTAADSAQALEEAGSPGEAARQRQVAEQRWEKARQDFAAVVEQNSANTDALQNLAYVNAQLGNGERATELYREYLNFNPDDAQVRMSVAHELAGAGELSEAVDILREGVNQDSTNASLWKYLGDVALRQGTSGDDAAQRGRGEVQDTAAVELAVEAYSHVLDLRGDSVRPSLLKNTIAAHLQMGNLQEALDFAERALEERPDDPTLWSLKADIHANQEEYAEAAAAMDSAIAADPGYDRVYLKRGRFRLRAGEEASAALSDFKEAAKREVSGDVIAQQLLAIGFNDYYKNGELEKALEMFRAGLEFAESGSDSSNQLHFFAAYAQYQMGEAIDKRNREEACQPAKRALQYFRNAANHLQNSGSYQESNQKKIRKAVDGYLYREKQIIKKSCPT